jgi:hypothetical protein
VFRGVAKVGEVLDFEACMDIMDLLYEKDETSIRYPPCSLAASILACLSFLFFFFSFFSF